MNAVDEMFDQTVLVAPREVRDLIQRASRVKGCEASVADHLATKVTFCEVYYGGGIRGWLQLVSEDTNCLSEVVASAQILDSLPANDVSEFSWNSPIPFVLIAKSLSVLQTYGFTWSCDPTPITGDALVRCVYLTQETSADHLLDDKMQKALSDGLKVNYADWKDLTNIAAEFLLSEEILDNSGSPVYE